MCILCVYFNSFQSATKLQKACYKHLKLTATLYGMTCFQLVTVNVLMY